MRLGFNSNVDVAGAVYHVQTEDRGMNHPFVDTLVLSGGRVIHRRSESYQDLLDGNIKLDETVLKVRVETQHREVVEAVRSGLLQTREASAASPIAVRLCNPTSWLVGGQAALEIEVLSRAEQKPVPGASVRVWIEGQEAATASEHVSKTGTDGRARLQFRMPVLAEEGRPALVIRAQGADAEDQVRYRLKPRARDSARPIR